MTTNPSKAESDAMVAFLAASEGDLEHRARLWNAVIELMKSNSENLVSGSNEVNTKYRGTVE